MEPEERARLEKLDAIVRSDELRAKINPVVDRVRAALSQKPEALMTWEPIPLEIFGEGLPPEIRSGWIFVLRAGADTGAERHPNSHQRMMTLHGSGDMRVRADAASSRWESNVLVSDPSARLERRWISIPPNVWHRPVVGRDGDWVVISFHTVPAEELIEEKMDESGAGTKQKKYVEGGKLRIIRKRLRIDVTQPDVANTTMIKRARVAWSFVGNGVGNRERRSGICPEEERTQSAARCT
jgi:hypothetical protein